MVKTFLVVVESSLFVCFVSCVFCVCFIWVFAWIKVEKNTQKNWLFFSWGVGVGCFILWHPNAYRCRSSGWLDGGKQGEEKTVVRCGLTSFETITVTLGQLAGNISSTWLEVICMATCTPPQLWDISLLLWPWNISIPSCHRNCVLTNKLHRDCTAVIWDAPRCNLFKGQVQG